MNIEIIGTGEYRDIVVTREKGDKKFRDGGYADGESTLLYHLKNHLNKMGYDLIKKRMYKDGHLVDDTQQYLRTRKATGDPEKDIMIYSTFYAIRGANEDWNNNGVVTLQLVTGIYGDERVIFKPTGGNGGPFAPCGNPRG